MTAERGGDLGAAARRLPLASIVLALLTACSPSPRDVIPAARDVRVAEGGGASETYEYVARRSHGVVALAEARHMRGEDARALVERLADDLERCAVGLEAQGTLAEGAARVVAVAGPDGTPAVSVRTAPGDAVAQNALLCIIAPVRATTLPPPADGATPGFAIEATWGPVTPAAPPADAGP